MSAYSLCRRAAVALIVLFVPAAASRGDTVFSNLGAGDSFNTVTSWTVGLTGSNTAQDVAGRFTVSSTAYFLDSAELALRHLAGSNQIEVYLFSDVGNLPGAQLASAGTVTVPSITPSLITANFGGSFLLAANTTYWLVADGGITDHVGWNQNNTGDLGFAFRQDAGAFQFNNGPAPAFRINGSPSGVQPVPLPAAAWAGLALIPLARLVQRRSVVNSV